MDAAGEAGDGHQLAEHDGAAGGGVGAMIVSALRDSGVQVTPSRVEAAPMDSTGQRMSRPWVTRLWPSMTAWSQPTRTGAE